MNEEIGERILQELKEHNPKKSYWKLFGPLMILLVAIVGQSFWELVKDEKEIPSWSIVNKMIDQGNLQSALNMALGLVIKTPNSHRAHASLASIYISMGRIDEALKCLTRAYELFPDSGYAAQIETLRSTPRKTCMKDIVVANTNLECGTFLGTNNLGLDSTNTIPRHAIVPEEAEMLIGHKIIRPIKFAEPILWTDTDIYITNKTIRQQ